MDMDASFYFLISILIHLYHIQHSDGEEIYTDYLTSSTNWQYSGDAVIPSSSARGCALPKCFELGDGGWVERAFSTKGYEDIYFNFYLHGNSDGTLMIFLYDAGDLISSIPVAFRADFSDRMKIKPPTTGEWDDIDEFAIRFAMEQDGNTAYFDYLRIFGTEMTSTRAPSNILYIHLYPQHTKLYIHRQHSNSSTDRYPNK